MLPNVIISPNGYNRIIGKCPDIRANRRAYFILGKSSNGPNEPGLDNAGVIHIDKKSIWIADMRVCMNYIQAINDLHNVV